ncbi:MAG: hypothetical protein EB833_03145, partial [Thaumarchaeota archaeon S13]
MTVLYAAPVSGGLAIDGALLPWSKAVTSDGAAPLLFAATQSPAYTLLVFSETVSLPDGHEDHWTVDGAPATVINQVESPPSYYPHSYLQLAHAPVATRASTPSVSYTSTDMPITDLAGNVFSETTITSRDDMHPILDAATPPYISGTNIIVTFDEPIMIRGDTLDLEVMHRETRKTVFARTTASGTEMIADLGAPPAEGTWEISLSQWDEESIRDLAYNRAWLEKPYMRATHVGPAATAAFTARTVNATLVEVTFGSQVTGAVSVSQWTVAGSPVSSLRETLSSASPASSLSGATALYLVTDPLAANARPAVAFTPPETPTLSNSDGNIAATTVMAADGIAPSVSSAATSSPTTVTLAFSEAVSGPTAAGE